MLLPGDQGDAVHRALGGDRFSVWFEDQFGKTCGCLTGSRGLVRFPHRHDKLCPRRPQSPFPPTSPRDLPRRGGGATLGHQL